MSDSIDRVFAHALQTVRRIPRTSSSTPGSAPRRPPAEDRLRLYGLFKQSTEGDVEGVMERPRTKGEQGRLEREKWDAWYSRQGLSKTEAKRRYITTLIETMHKYASDTPESRELVSELEFVWNQVKNNQSNQTSNPPSVHSQSRRSSFPKPPFDPLTTSPPPSPSIRSRTLLAPPTQYKPRAAISDAGRTEKTISSLGVSNVDAKERQEEEDSTELEIDEDVVPNRMVTSEEEEGSEDDGNLNESLLLRSQGQDGEVETLPRGVTQDDSEGLDIDEDQYLTNHRMVIGRAASGGGGGGASASTIVAGLAGTRNKGSDSVWRSHIENALLRINVEVAALREQLESGDLNRSSQSWWGGNTTFYRSSTGRRKSSGGFSGRIGAGGIRSTIVRILINVIWVVFKHIMVDAVVIGVMMWWLGRRGDRKTVRWMRWFLGLGRESNQRDGN